MEKAERKTKNDIPGRSTRNKISIFRFPFSVKKVCSACGSESNRETASFCLVCGKSLDEGYQPLDAIRSSYGLQRKSLGIAKEYKPTALFEVEKNVVSETAWACVVYAMVPYLGILFVPFAFLAGGYGYVIARRNPDLGGGRLALICIGLSFVILAVQIFLWWLLYIIPEIGVGIFVASIREIVA